MKTFTLPPDTAQTSGIVTFGDYVRMPDGEQYVSAWCERWEVITNKAMPIDGFHSSERWQLAAVVNGDVVLLIPGCNVKCWAHSTQPVQRQMIYVVKA